MPQWDPRSPKAGERAPDLDLLDEAGRPVNLSQVAGRRPLLVLVFAAVDDPEVLRFLRDYRDLTLAFRRAGVSVCAIGHDEPAALRYMRSERALGFPLLADPDGTALSRLGMLDKTGLFLLDRELVVKQRALGGRVPAEAMLTFVKRGGARTKFDLRARVAQFVQTLQHAFHALKPARQR